jgi:hypothetical protein
LTREPLHNWLYDQVKQVSGASDLAKAMLGDPALAGLGGVPLRWLVEMDTNVSISPIPAR